MLVFLFLDRNCVCGGGWMCVCAVQFWSLLRANNKAKLEAVQRRIAKMMLSLRDKSHNERPARLNLLPSEKHQLGRKLAVFYLINDSRMLK